MDFLNTGWHNLIQKPILDRIFYVPFWDCPYLCDFCCVDSLPGRPGDDFSKGEALLFDLLDKMFRMVNKPIQIHVYGGEPLLKPSYIKELAIKLKKTGKMSKFYLYTTLRPSGLESITDVLDESEIRVIVNPNTVTETVRGKLKKFSRIAVIYKNPVFFPTGRAKKGETSYKQTIWEKILPFGLPGKSCFANASGPLVNGAHGTVHLCCLPQSPVVGEISESINTIWNRYLDELGTFYKEAERIAKEKGFSFSCSVCEYQSSWNTKIPPDTSHLKDSGIQKKYTVTY